MLSGQNAAAFQALMTQEVADGRVPAPRTINLDGPPQQPMQMWEYPDGTVVRYKPLGDSRRSTPTFSIEVKKDASLPDSGSDSVAFKVDANGKPIPKNPHEVMNPFPKNTNPVRHKAFIEELREAAHLSLTP